MLSCRDLGFHYGETLRLKNINIDFDKIIGLFGQNGSGKSTLLKILGGSLPVKNGQITYLGQSILGKNGFINEEFRKNLGILFQETSSDEKISAHDNLFYACLLLGIKKSAVSSVIEETLNLSGLTERAFEPVKKLSGGMRRRLELYRTFMHEPKVLLLDEPTSGLDVAEAKRFFEFLKAYQKKHDALVIISSHSPEELLICERVLLLHQGEIIADDSPKSLLNGLDYLRLSFKLEQGLDFDPNGLEVFDWSHDKKAGILSGKILAANLSSFLTGQGLKNLKGFTVDKPNLADAYQSMLTPGDDHVSHL